ncbi:hypothetical protein WDY80_23725 (plasmid) [Gordonia hongkongensis]|uniref:Uncharacterized protein n=1 Tax=Gordonia hongkongensis TaxID=1701090 RepID=A0ABT6BYG9_9ACTN|nr:hypothetical protein [Gordonia hongkongensis]MDF6103107.1 hypothetical protein [Gordonia hongkongensis]
MFTGLTNTIVNLFTPGGESGAKAMEAGYRMAMFYVAGGHVAIEANGHNDRTGACSTTSVERCDGTSASLAVPNVPGQYI